MKTALALRHVHFEDLGTLEPLLQTRGYQVRYLDPTVDALGADAVVGIDIDYETVGKDSSMLMVSVSGTAVKTRR